MLFQLPAGSKLLFLLQSVQIVSGAYSKIDVEFFLAVKRFMLETDHTLPSSTEVKNYWITTPFPGGLDRDNFNFIW